MGERALTAGLIFAAGFIFCHSTHAAEFDKNEALIAEVNKALSMDRVASKQDRRINRESVTLEVKWKIDADFNIVSKPKFKLHASNTGVVYTKNRGWEIDL